MVSIVEQIVLEIFTAVMLKAGTALFLKQIQTGDNSSIKDPYVCHVFLTGTYLWTDLTDPDCDPRRKIMDLKNKEAEA